MLAVEALTVAALCAYVMHSNTYLFKPKPPLRKRLFGWWRKGKR